MKKKTYSAMALGLAAALSLAACGSAPSSSSSADASGSAAAGSSDFTACMVSDEGGFDDQSFNQSGKEGLDKAESELGVKTIAVESQSAADYPTNVDSLVQQGCNLIIGVGFNLAEDMTSAAKANPDIEFALIDSSFTEDGLDNAKPLIFKTSEAAYLAGYAAAGTSHSGKVATYGGQAIPTVQIFMDGFAQGVAKYNEDNGKDVQVLGWDTEDPESGSFVGDFSNTTKGQQLTEQFLSQGADLILPVAGPVGLGTLSSVKAAGGDNGVVWVDSDGYNATSEGSIIMTSIVKEIGTAVYDTVDQAQQGKFTADPYIGTLKNGGVGIADYHDWSSKVPSDVQTQVKDLEQQIIDGKLEVSTSYDPS